ncbi:MAG: tryptophan 7-halogenase [Planctomycetales bacterium]|nr:tryptophan 7-halogenase [Planctomycetales bacterium]
MNEIKTIVVVGAGSAGLLSAMTLKRAFSRLDVKIVHSPDIPVIGVGESTTAIFPPFLHSSLGIDFVEFFTAVQASWKLGVRFVWGDPKDSHFNYTFDSCMSTKSPHLRKAAPYYCLSDWSDASPSWALMDRGLSPCFRRPDGQTAAQVAFGYHIENQAFIDFLTKKAVECGIETISGNVADATQDESGNVEQLLLTEGRSITADLFVDCTGFGSQLLRGKLDETFVSYRDSLFCDRAVVGQWQRSDPRDPVLPYTTTETMDHGWCWRIDFPSHVTRGYVFCSAFCSDAEATAEFKSANPQLNDDIRVVPFTSGRYEGFWRKNVVAIGNSCGFVEPLEATALHLVVEQIRMVCRLLSETDLRLLPEMESIANRQYRVLWDEVRDFLAVHYRFNRKRDTPFWQHCRENTDLAGAADFVELYQRFGPSTLGSTTLSGENVFGYDGFTTLLVGQRVPTDYQPLLFESDAKSWLDHQNRIREYIQAALPMDVALKQFGTATLD